MCRTHRGAAQWEFTSCGSFGSRFPTKHVPCPLQMRLAHKDKRVRSVGAGRPSLVGDVENSAPRNGGVDITGRIRAKPFYLINPNYRILVGKRGGCGGCAGGDERLHNLCELNKNVQKTASPGLVGADCRVFDNENLASRRRTARVERIFDLASSAVERCEGDQSSAL